MSIYNALPDRVTDGLLGCDASTVTEKLYIRLADKAEDLARNGGGVIVLPFDEVEEPGAEITVRGAHGEIIKGHKRPSHRLTHLDRPFLRPARLGGQVVFVEHAPRILNFDREVEALVRQGKVVVASGLRSEWERSRLELPFETESLNSDEASTKTTGNEWEELNVARLCGALKASDTRNLLLTVLACDAWGVALPFYLLAAAAGLTPRRAGALVEKCSREGLLNWIELPGRADLVVSTPGERLSRAVLSELLAEGVRPETVVEQWKSVLAAAQGEEMDDRYATLRLVHGLTLAARTRWELLGETAGIAVIRELAAGVWDNLTAHAESVEEWAAWGRMGTDIGLHRQSEAVLRAALARAPGEVGLILARAHNLARWSRFEPDRVEEARASYQQAANVSEGAPNVLRAWAKFETAVGASEAARRLLGRALQGDQGNSTVLVALAELDVREERWEDAEATLAVAEREAPEAPWGRLTRARLALGRGDWDEAYEGFQSLLEVPGFRLECLNGLASLAEAEGQMPGEVERRFERVLVQDPENVTALVGVARTAVQTVELSLLEKMLESAKQALKGAGNKLGVLLSVDPLNRAGVAARASVEVLRRLAGRAASGLTEFWEAEPLPVGLTGSTPELEAVPESVDDVLARYPANAEALIAAGRLAALAGDFNLAKKRLQEGLRIDKDSVVALFALLEISVREGNQEEFSRIAQDIESALDRIRDPSLLVAAWRERLRVLRHALRT